MLALMRISGLVIWVCTGFLIWSAVKNKTKRYWAIGIGVGFILFMVGAVNSTPTQNTVYEPATTPTRSTPFVNPV